MICEAGETQALERRKVDRGRGDGWDGGEAIEEGKFDKFWHGDGEQDCRAGY